MSYRVIFKQDPAKVILDITALKNGEYLVDGSFSSISWSEICQKLCLEPAGEGKARLEITKQPGAIKVVGRLDLTLKRQCVRTGEWFMDTSALFIDELLPIEYDPDQHTLDIQAPEILDLGQYITEQIILELDPYPMSPETQGIKRGSFSVLDGFEQHKNQISSQPEELKATGTDNAHPFQVLARLKN